MKKATLRLSKISCFVMAFVLLMCMCPVPVSAVTSEPSLLMCIAADSNADVVDVRTGIPVLIDGTGMVITTSELNKGDDHVYICTYGEEGLSVITIVEQAAGMLFFALDGLAPEDCYDINERAVVGEDARMILLDSEGNQRSSDLSIEGYNTAPTPDGLWELEVNAAIPDYSFTLPAAVVNEDNVVIAIVLEKNNAPVFYAFAEPAGGAVESTESVPPARETMAPETEPTEAVETTPETVSEDLEKTADPETRPENRIGMTVAMIAGVVAVLVVVFFAVKKRTSKSSASAAQTVNDVRNYNIPDISQTRPVPETQPVLQENQKMHLGDGWESVPENHGVMVYIVGTGGAMTGQAYPIIGQSILIGRAEEANIRLPADTKGVSRRHCKVMLHHGALMIMDLGSTSGTFIKGQGQLTPNTPVPVTDGDVIYLGSKQNSFTIRVK